MFELILLMLLFGFISINLKSRYMVGVSLKQISSFLFWTVVIYKDREKEITYKQSLIPSHKRKISN